MKQVKIGIIGIGNMGSCHAKSIMEGKIPELKLVAIADRKEERRNWAEQEFAGEITIFNEGEDLIRSGICEAVVIATPHYQHPGLSIMAL
ncbi:MAG: Gfo/Idh/MocA family oxidoreductase, partial [Hungatella sp.]